MRIFAFILGLTSLFSTHAIADSALLQTKAAQDFINEMVTKDKISRQTLVLALREAKFQPQIIELMERPYEKKNWDVYRSLFLTRERAIEGAKFWRENEKTLQRVEKQYGVPASIIVAILGVETRYGLRQGDYRVLDALATLAFYYPKRSPYFTKELREYILLCNEHHVPVTKYVGSYAGAIGQPQFMPSNYRVYAVDYTQKGYRDLIGNKEDVIASVANFFKAHGWQTGQAVTVEAKVTSPKYKKLTLNTRQPIYESKRLPQFGISPIETLRYPPKTAGVLELTTAKGPEYWIAYPNFYAITRYNSSPHYALAVYLLAGEIAKERNKA